MIFLSPGFMNSNNALSRNPMQAEGSGKGQDAGGTGQGAVNGADFLQMLVRVAGAESAKALVPAETGEPSGPLSREELADLFEQIMAFLDASGLGASDGVSVSDQEGLVSMPRGENSTNPFPFLEGLPAGFGSTHPGKISGQNQSEAAVLARAMDSLPAGQMRQVLAQMAEGRSGRDSGAQTDQSLRALLQSLVEDLKAGEKNAGQSGGRPDRPDTQGSNPAEQGRQLGRDRDLTPEITALLKKVAQDQGRATGKNAGLSSDAAMQALQEFAAKNGRANQGTDDGQSLRLRLQDNESFPNAEITQNAEKNPRPARSRDNPGSDNLRAMLDSLVSSSMEKSTGMEKAQNRQAVLKDGSPLINANMNPSGTAAGVFERPENAASTVQPGGASFDSQVKAAENQVVNQVSVRLFTGVRQGSGNMTIQIHPPELGSVKVKLVSEQGSLHVHLHPQNQQVAAILERHLPALHQSLADQGIDLSGLQVSVDSGQDQDGARFEQQAEDFFTDQRNPAAEPEAEESHLSESVDPDGIASYNQGSGLSLRV